MPIIEQMISSGNGPANASTKSAVRSGCCSIIRSTSLAATCLHLLLDSTDVLGREALRHDRTEAEVLGVVHRDHRAEELAQLGVEVADVHPTASRAEQLGVAARVPHVIVAGDRVVAGPGWERGVFERALRVERQAGGGAQLRPCRGPCRTVAGPERSSRRCRAGPVAGRRVTTSAGSHRSLRGRSCLHGRPPVRW